MKVIVTLFIIIKGTNQSFRNKEMWHKSKGEYSKVEFYLILFDYIITILLSLLSLSLLYYYYYCYFIYNHYQLCLLSGYLGQGLSKVWIYGWIC